MIGAPLPAGLPALAVMALSFFAFMAAVLAARLRRGREERGGATRSRRSVAGIVIQGVGIGYPALGPLRVTLDPLSAAALGEAALCTALMVAAIGLFVWASQTMGRNWSLVARTRADHVLIERGPFAHVRHPIYTALFVTMIAIAIAYGHEAGLLIAIPLFALGTWLRVGEEERLLRAMFGADYEDYARRVPRFVPGLF